MSLWSKSHFLFRILWHSVNAFLVLALLLFFWGLIKEYSLRSYLRGFVDAIINSADPEVKQIEDILAWMRRPLAPVSSSDFSLLSLRDPINNLNSQRLLSICGSATNAFVNLVRAAGIPARRLLLLNEKGVTLHVVTAVYLEGRWAIVDPAFHVFLRDRQGLLLTKQQLRDPQVLQEVIQSLENYNPSWDYKHTAYIHLEKIPYMGHALRKILAYVGPKWEKKIDWTGILERTSAIQMVIAGGATSFALCARLALQWFMAKRLGIILMPLRQRLLQALRVLFMRG